MKFRFSKFAAAAALVLLSPLAGCPGQIDDTMGTGGTGGPACVPQGGTTNPMANYAAIKTLFNQGEGAVSSCVSAPCHGDFGQAPPNKPLSLQDGPNLYKTMTTYVSHACGDIPLIVPGKPAESALIKILTTGCGATPRMPYQCVDDQCISPDMMDAITQWIANCAPQQ